jgi:NhaP-type Na+/H+ or K+/H+ antiporter
VIRTFFFVIFGFTIVLSTLLDYRVWLVSMSVLVVLFGLRYAYFRLVVRKNIFPGIWLAPRGLITILLFYSIPESLALHHFNEGILLLVILVSAIIMAVALIRHKKITGQDPELEVVAMTDEEHVENETLPPRTE